MGNNILVIIQGLQLMGSEAGNYALGQITASGNIISTALTIGLPVFNGSTRSMSVMTATGPKYNLEFKTSLSDPNWTQSDSVIGDGTQKTLTDPSPNSTTRFYRIRVGP